MWKNFTIRIIWPRDRLKNKIIVSCQIEAIKETIIFFMVYQNKNIFFSKIWYSTNKMPFIYLVMAKSVWRFIQHVYTYCTYQCLCRCCISFKTYSNPLPYANLWYIMPCLNDSTLVYMSRIYFGPNNLDWWRSQDWNMTNKDILSICTCVLSPIFQYHHTAPSTFNARFLPLIPY